ncbi:hypothetical protein BaRGS_00000109 [Batillaria attramentaria]|uniref:Uncharacterized protein n=1 Tax=Batillaria attramentaria TaxID=370345 RepID=A0ABD0MAV5_9CAEN
MSSQFQTILRRKPYALRNELTGSSVGKILEQPPVFNLDRVSPRRHELSFFSLSVVITESSDEDVFIQVALSRGKNQLPFEDYAAGNVCN